ncbi:unnamed protein product [Sympodiomycopsis kandeliae]
MSAVTASLPPHSTTASASSSSSVSKNPQIKVGNAPTSSIPTVDSLTSDLSHANLDSIDSVASDPRTLKQKLLGTDADGDDKPTVTAYLRGRVYNEGGESLLVIGGQGFDGDGKDSMLSKDEYTAIKSNIIQASKEIACEASILFENATDNKAWIMLRQIPAAPQDFVEIRVACVGNVDAGKSTTLGVLTRGGLDDGRGKARVNLFRHKHEMETGRTSSVGMELLGLTAKGEHVTTAAGSKEEGRKLSWEELCARSAKIVNFIDLAGHERYLRTTIGGLTANIPEYGMLMVGANAGLIGMSKEHLGVALALSIPVFITITKIDMCPPQILETTIKQLTKVLKSPGCRKTPVFVENMEQVVDCAARLGTERICPIFQISNVTGHNVGLLRSFLNILPQSGLTKFDPSLPFELQISDIFSVPFVGTVVSGVLTSGSVKVGDNLLIGPDSLGQFIQTSIRSIQRKRVNVENATAGQSASFALKRVRRNQVRKGMVMIAKNDDEPPKAYLTFDAEILCLHHATTLSVGSCMVLHAAGIRQTVKITAIAKMDGTHTSSSTTDEKPVIRTGDRAVLRLQFIRTPEFVKPGVRLITREGRTRLIGRIAAVGGQGPLIPDSSG